MNGGSGTDVESFLGSGSKLSWYYDWSVNPLSGWDELEFVPQVWSAADVTAVQGAESSWPSGTNYVLSFNEPDQSSANGGSDIDAATAATLHQQWVSSLGGDYTIASPAVARGGIQWMQDWVSACNGNCVYDIVAFHFYGTDANDLITYAQSFSETFNKPLWLTEFACIDYDTGDICTDAEVEAFQQTAIGWFRGDGASIVQRWAWFGAFIPTAANPATPNTLEAADGSALAVGVNYVSM